jgi:hypothetical protein
MVHHVFVLHVVDLARAQGSDLDQPGLVRRTTHNAQA